MQTERWQQIEQLFHAALERVSHERVAYLRETSGGDLELQLEVESLLGAHEASGRLETAAPDLAEEWLNGRQPLVGQTLKHFQILAHLDSGGMGDVYLAEDNRVHRKVALKLGNSSREESCNRSSGDYRNPRSSAGGSRDLCFEVVSQPIAKILLYSMSFGPGTPRQATQSDLVSALLESYNASSLGRTCAAVLASGRRNPEDRTR